MNTLQFFLTFLILTTIGSSAIIGFYICTRGEWIMTPDGKLKKTGMIFMYWSLFWEQFHKTKTIRYKDEGLKEKFQFLQKVHPKIAERLFFMGDCLSILNRTPLAKGEIDLIKDALLCDIELKETNLYLSVTDPVYDWPEWVQKPISSCPTCMAGPYGTAIWLAFLKVQRDAFQWTDYPLFAKVAFFIIFLLTLSTINTYISRKMKL